MESQPFTPFLDPAVQRAVQQLGQLVSDVALRAGQTPLTLIMAAAALPPKGGLVDVDTLICGDDEPDLITILTRRIVQTALNADGQSDPLDLTPAPAGPMN